ncbi:MAG: TIM barrel protein [Planctomycetaceae bacterium]|nr:TIM barrel protein [Planctomycetaceae bacterium]
MPWWSKLVRPLWTDSCRKFLAGEIPVALHQSLVCGDDLADQVAALQTRPQWAFGVLRKRLWQFGLQRSAELFHRRNITVSSLNWAGGFTGSLGFQFREAVDDALSALEEADCIGTRTLVIAPGGQGTFTYRHARRMAIDGVQRLLAPAADRRLRLAILVDLGTKASQRSLIQSWTAAAEFLEDIGAPHVGLAGPLPTISSLATGSQAWEACAAKLFIVTSQAEPGSVGRQSLGSGPADVATVFARLKSAGFRGTWEFASPTCAAPWWNGREALLHCCSWVNTVSRQLSRVRAG